MIYVKINCIFVSIVKIKDINKKMFIMKKFIVFLFTGILYLLNGFPVYSQTANPVLRATIWYDSEQDTVSQRENSLFNKQSVAETTIAQDSIIPLNFHKVKPFNENVSPIQSIYDIGITSRLTVIVVFHSSDTLGERGIWSVSRNGKQITGLTDKQVLRPNSQYVYPVKRRGIPLINTSIQAFSKIRGKAESNYFTMGQAILPDSTLSSFSGDIAECLVFDRFLKRQEALKIETYLAIKYGITLIETDYISPFEVVVWNYEANKAYSHCIAGLGRDSVWGLDQKQGSSSEETDLLTLGVGSFSSLNKDNSFGLKEGNYLLWGHNNEALTVENVQRKDYPLLERKWLIQNTNTQKNSFSTWVKFRLPNLYRDSSQICYLVIDRSGNGNFASEEIEYIAQNQIDSAGYVYFSDITWDWDGNGRDAFTFSINKRKDSVLWEVADTIGEVLSLKHKHFSEYGSENISETGSSSHYSLYPNPTTGQYRLEADLPDVASIVVRIYTLNGRLVEEKTDSGKNYYSFAGTILTLGNYRVEVESVFEKKNFSLVVVK